MALFSRIFSMPTASGGFAPRHPPGVCPWTPLADFHPTDPRLSPPLSKLLATPLPVPSASDISMGALVHKDV